MDHRRLPEDRAAMARLLEGENTPIVSEATGIPITHLEDLRHGSVAPAMSDLVKVGGFARVRPETLLRGVA